MSDVKINELLGQIRSISSQLQPDLKLTNNTDEKVDFSSVLKSSVDKVNEQQMKATDLVNRFEKGDPQVELANVMIEMQKARVSFEAVKQVRNQLVTAYQEIMSMPV